MEGVCVSVWSVISKCWVEPQKVSASRSSCFSVQHNSNVLLLCWSLFNFTPQFSGVCAVQPEARAHTHTRHDEQDCRGQPALMKLSHSHSAVRSTRAENSSLQGSSSASHNRPLSQQRHIKLNWSLQKLAAVKTRRSKSTAEPTLQAALKKSCHRKNRKSFTVTVVFLYLAVRFDYHILLKTCY